MNLSVMEQLAIISQQATNEVQRFVMYACFAALGVIALIFFIRYLGKALAIYLNSTKRLGRIGQIYGGIMIIAAILYGGTKPTVTRLWKFEYTNGVSDNGSYCTNNEIRASWSYNLAAMEYTLKAYYQNLTITNASGTCTDSLHSLEDCLVKDCNHLWYVDDATNMRVVVYAQYVRPPAVHTNGVYKLSGVMKAYDGSEKYITPGVQVRFNMDSGEYEVFTPTNEPPPLITLPTLNSNTDEGE